ncbi:CLUMA_CG009771, isoform A [Clunio marinus]|uniref:CLUMA_CG009771, isoform A n=1 Tax=Clunio marinus TaxID=568069 RepID=A0A1J1I9E2_9DIPT|nr:CLUMA_CG009771, isoform A [Clunio marinus]
MSFGLIFENQFPFSKDQVRILLFRECDWRGRRLLFDSSAIEVLTSTQQAQHVALNVNKPSPLKLDKNHVEFCDGKAYKYSRPNPDFKTYGEMMFGSVAIAFRGTSFQVHWLQPPARILCSQVFLAPVQPYSSTSSSSTNTHSSSSNAQVSSNYMSDYISDISSSISETNSLNSFSDSAQNISLRTNPLDVPTTLSLDNDDFRFISQSMGDGSSGYNSSEPYQNRYSSARSSLASIYSDIDNLSRKMSIDSSSDFASCEYGRFNRRIMKNLSTSFENVSTITENLSIIDNNYYTVTGASNFVGVSDGCVSKLRRNSEVVDRRKTNSGDALSSNSSTLHHRTKRPRLAIAVCITMTECMEQEMQCFCAEHMALLESMLYRLRSSIESAYINRQNFVPLMIKTWHNASQWLVDLFSAPRLTSPMWLILSTSVKSPTVLVNTFIQDLMSLINTADTKDSNFFISTLVTAVLTHHLGWVGTVAPLVTSNIRDNLMKTGNVNPVLNKLLQEENFKLSELSKVYPYNALWAQLGELYGAITNPVKLSKTVICGSEASSKTIDKLLNVLTYFIRCCEIRRNSYTKIFDRDEINKTVNQQMNMRQDNQTSNKSNNLIRVRKTNGFARTATKVKDLSTMGREIEDETKTLQLPENISEADAETYRLLLKILKKNVMNDIPKVLAFRDSRFVKQELRIGNKSMDTGIEMTAKDKQFLSKYQKNLMGDHIKFTVTRPDGDGTVELIDLDDDSDFNNQLDNFVNLSDLITANSLGGTQSVMKLFWGKESHKESLNLEQVKHLERMTAKHQQMQEEANEKLKTIPETDDGKNGVVFVIGDSDKLVGLKMSPSMQTIKNFNDDGLENETSDTGTIKKTCKHHKKHLGVKFKFEKYPQIATSYMKRKNLEFRDYEVLEKGLKLNNGPSTSTTLRSDFPSTATLQSFDETDSEDECENCRNGNEVHYLQTPSNATDLEFSCDQMTDNNLLPLNSRNLNELNTTAHFQSLQTLDEDSELKSADDSTKLIEIPMLESVRTPSVKDEIVKPGFSTSLFTATSDHYIADMVLQEFSQGITSPPSKWELQLKHDLTVSSHCAVLEHSQAENIAIVANIDKWDVRLVSSNNNLLPSNNTANGIVGMSQLIATMLETVQALYNSGASEFQCLSFIESKLREIYLHSETLATFLLDTEFCSLNTLTTALNLSVNDIPLLMSVASIHSPMIAKKYGITFR